MDFTPYLNFNGDCAEAFKFYEQTLNGTIEVLQTHGDTPICDQVPAEWRDKVMHARLNVRGQVLMGSDAPAGQYEPPQGMFVTINVETTADGERIFNALAENGRTTLPFQKTFWSPGFGMAVDRFGIPWMVNSEHAA